MIVKMKKVTLLVSEKHAGPAVEALRKSGLMHIKHMREPKAHAITSFQHRLAVVDKALDIIKCPFAQRQDLNEEQLAFCIKEIITLEKERQELINWIEDLKKKTVWFKEWGDFSPANLAELRKAGVFIKLYVCPKKSLRHIPAEKLVYVTRKKKGVIYLAFVSIVREESLDFPEIEIPCERLRLLQKKIFIGEGDLRLINKKLNEFSVYRNCLIKHREKILKSLEFNNVRFGMAYNEGICSLSGFCPQESVAEITKAAFVHGWAIITEEPNDFKEAPTLIRNPKWIEIIKPVFKFMGTVPGYKEYDISFWFLIFFSIFFAMIISDGGYGLVLLLAAFFARKKFPALPRPPFFLIYVLAGVTIIWGAVSGTWFGFEKIARLPFLKSLVVPKLNNFVEANQTFLMYLCFLIGVVQLTIAHGIVTLRYLNSLMALAQIGWIFIVWGIFFLAKSLVLEDLFPAFAGYLLIAGTGLVILFSNPQKNILKGMLISLADLPLKLISCFGDTLSYIRLFAVGYASVMIAVSFNKIALGVGFNSPIKGLCAVLILVAAHSFNIVLGLMAILVHGIRLNMLEFSGHLNMEWSGSEYKPFRE